MGNKVSVIMNTYKNNPSHLREAIDSYLLQNEPELEVELIISTVRDDISAQEIAKEKGCVLVVSDKPGIYQQINKAAKKVTGDFICYASGNDVSISNKLKLETSLLNNSKHVCYSAFTTIDEKANHLKKRSFYDYDYKKHLHGNFVNDCAMMSREMFDKYFPLEVKFKNHAYYDMWLRIAENEGNVFVYNPESTWLYRQDKNSQHLLRKKDPVKIKENERNRAKMLAFHGYNKGQNEQ